MGRYAFDRLLQGIVTLSVLAVVVFFLARLTGNPLDLYLPMEATEADRAHVAQALGLDRPLYVQFAGYVKGLATADFGDSVRWRTPARELFLKRLPTSMSLVALSLVFSFAAALLLGVVSAVKRYTAIDTAASVISVIGMAAPTFWVGLVLMQVFGVWTQILPVARVGDGSSFVLPVVTLSLFMLAGMTRLLRSSMLEALDSEFVKLARIKGASEYAVVFGHCLRNALLPVLNFAAVYFGILITGTLVVESVFAWPGVGRLTYEAVMWRDFPVLQAAVIVQAAFVVGANFVTDILNAYLDPRIRRPGR